MSPPPGCPSSALSPLAVFGKFLEIHSCPGLKRLEGIRCPALAVARVTGCRELSSLGLEEAFVLSHLDLAGCVRLEPWELPPPAPPGGNSTSSGGAGFASLAELRVRSPSCMPYEHFKKSPCVRTFSASRICRCTWKPGSRFCG